tara:strand:+ start:254 stop:700 length:447 start_codon:yes stop_codon:yes gene_type:complete
MPKRKPNLIDRFASFLPGYGDYIEKKESYNLSRNFKTELILSLKNKITEVQRIKVEDSVGLKQKNQFIEELINLTDRINSASYGYSSLFAKQQISKIEFESIRVHDLDIAEIVSNIVNMTTFDETLQPFKEAESAITKRQIKISTYVK